MTTQVSSSTLTVKEIRRFIKDKAYAKPEEIHDLATVNDPELLEKRYWECPLDLQTFIIARYQEILKEVADLGALEEWYRRYPSVLEASIIARYQEVLPRYLAEVNLNELVVWWDRMPFGLRSPFIAALQEYAAKKDLQPTSPHTLRSIMSNS